MSLRLTRCKCSRNISFSAHLFSLQPGRSTLLHPKKSTQPSPPVDSTHPHFSKTAFNPSSVILVTCEESSKWVGGISNANTPLASPPPSLSWPVDVSSSITSSSFIISNKYLACILIISTFPRPQSGTPFRFVDEKDSRVESPPLTTLALTTASFTL